MKILGIGNAIVDVLCKVEDKFIQKNSLTKSTMKLVDEKEFNTLLSSLKISETVAGGSVANSIVGLSQLGNNVGFIGKVSDDELGVKYEEGLKKEKVKYFYSKKKEKIPTGTCLILITPDSERTMVTFLGTAGKINEDDIDVNAIKKSDILFLELKLFAFVGSVSVMLMPCFLAKYSGEYKLISLGFFKVVFFFFFGFCFFCWTG